VVLLALCGTGGFLLLNKGITRVSGSPQATTTAFLDALKSRDAAKARDLTCSARKSTIRNPSDTLGASGVAIDDFSYTVGNSTVSGDTATVDATVSLKATVAGQSTSVSSVWKFDLTKESGWKVCDLNIVR
jgi:hypothetical protein